MEVQLGPSFFCYGTKRAVFDGVWWHSSHVQARKIITPGFPMVVMIVKMIFFNGQFIVVYTCKPHMNHKYSLVLITPRIFNSKMLFFG